MTVTSRRSGHLLVRCGRIAVSIPRLMSALRPMVVAFGGVPLHQPVRVAHAEPVGRVEGYLNELCPGGYVAAVASADGVFQGS